MQVGKESYPGLTTIVAATSSEFNEGQTVVFGGLNQIRIEAANVSSVPVVSSIPYIGSAFKSVREDRNELATFVLVRPEIVQPPNADNSPTAEHKPSDYDVQR